MNITIPQVASKFWAFNGGLDQVTPPLEIFPGACKSMSNVEIGVNGGYLRFGGYERFDGRPKPSDAVYHTLAATITGSYAVGNTLTGLTSGATGVIVMTGVASTFVLTKMTGTFASGESLQIAAVTIATATAGSVVGGASTMALNATWMNLAADQYRVDIAVVPGSGSILGVWQYNDTVYAIRNNVAATAAVVHVKSSSGWTPIALGREVTFTSGGTYQVLVGNTITGATSAATAVITKVILSSGSWAAGTAAGRLFFATQTGTFQAEDLNVGASLNVATIAGDSTAITLLPSGRYEFDNWNFGGAAGSSKIYGCDGVNKGFEFDGTHWVQITTGMTTDTPTHVKAHKNHLFFSFSGSVQHSSIANPYTFSPTTGAAELACGDTITALLELAGNQANAAMAIYTQNKTLVLYGNSSADWNLISFSEEAGAIPYTAQFIRTGVCLDKQGIKLLSTTQNYGNFLDAVVSDNITPYLYDLIDTAIASTIVRKKNQYRLFFSGGGGVTMTFKGGKILGLTTIDLANPVACICSAEGASNREEIYFGSTDGFVYQMEVGTSYDGTSIPWHIELAYNHLGSPRQLKQFRKVATEVSGNSYAEFSLSYNLGYGKTEFASSSAISTPTELSGSSWDTGSWDQLFWDGQTLTPSENDIAGTAENISIMYSGNSDEFAQFTLNGAILHYVPRRNLR